jgi:hypothetical protein
MFKIPRKLKIPLFFWGVAAFVPALFPEMSRATSLDVLEETAQQEVVDYMNSHRMFIQAWTGNTVGQLQFNHVASNFYRDQSELG